MEGEGCASLKHAPGRLVYLDDLATKTYFGGEAFHIAHRSTAQSISANICPRASHWCGAQHAGSFVVVVLAGCVVNLPRSSQHGHTLCSPGLCCLGTLVEQYVRP